ncbi:MFS transporter [Leucobacter manosquensis]|uniref:MFS transporter n=1 Tax=Leucobacter manosquensis TaxID=2810611 RepID=A0ABS5M6Z2_9MICO|nr:MFS transporter [Leucobacter manosquensis]MBS3182978.1 MFS transporter [Leucobacter manosquensis]
MTNSAPAFLWRLAPSIYGPSVLFSLGEYAILPLVAVIAVEMGASIALAGVIASAAVVGQVLGNLPASWVVSRAGERAAMLLAAAVALLGCLGVAFAPTPALLGAAVLVIGFAAASFGLARHAFMTTRVPLHFRARALSLLGGTNRLGRFIGPFLAAAMIAATGDPEAPVWAFAACLVLAAALVAWAPDPERAAPDPERAAPDASADGSARSTVSRTASRTVPSESRPGVLGAVRDGGAALLRIGGASAILSGMRSIKDVLLPLWGVSIGLDATQVALVVGISGTVDFLFFYTSGQIMDRFGRLWASLPAMVVMAIGFLVLAGTHDLPGAGVWLLVIAIVVGLGNGLSSGINMTLGADLAPADHPAPFLAAWRTLTDFGGAVAPLAVSGLAAVSLPVASVAAGLLAVAGAVGFGRWIPRYLPHVGRRPPRSAD